MTDQVRHWQTLKQQAVDGELTMDNAIGSALHARCSTLLDELDAIRREVSSLNHLSGYGGLPSARDMKGKFEKKADGAEDGDSAGARIDEMIQVVILMRDTYAAAIGQLQETDQQNSSQTTAVGEGLH